MGKLVVSLDNVVIKEVPDHEGATTLGRRPYNDIVIDNLAVSGEHAVLRWRAADVFIEDLNSTNGTYINGKAVKKQLLANNDIVEVGKYRIKFLAEDGDDYEKTMIMSPGASAAPALHADRATSGTCGARRAPASAAARNLPGPRSIKVLNGGAAGREVLLTKVVTTVGKPGVQVASDHQAPGRLRAVACRRLAPADRQRRARGRRLGPAEATATSSSWPARRCSSSRTDLPLPAAACTWSRCQQGWHQAVPRGKHNRRMKIRVLGCSGSIAADGRTTSFLVDDDVLIDAGTGVGDLTLDELVAIDHILVSHSHLDHVLGIGLLADSVVRRRQSRSSAPRADPGARAARRRSMPCAGTSSTA